MRKRSAVWWSEGFRSSRADALMPAHGRRMEVLRWLLLMSSSCFFLVEVQKAEATDHLVGANHGWQVPSNAGPSVNLNYTVWAESQKFYLGDEISFRYPEGMYTVFQVNYSVYTNCTINMYVGHDWIYNWTNKGGRTVVPLNETKVYYFADASHCQEGMKVFANVTTNATAPSASRPSSSSALKDSNDAAASRGVSVVGLALGQTVMLLCVWLVFRVD